MNIRKATMEDISRIAEILVFTKRVNYRRIFKDDNHSFNQVQVLPTAEEYGKPEVLQYFWVYDDGIVKGLIHIEEEELVELYVDSFFSNQGIGTALMNFAKENFPITFLWALEENHNAIRFYERHGFRLSGIRKPTMRGTEYLVHLERI